MSLTKLIVNKLSRAKLSTAFLSFHGATHLTHDGITLTKGSFYYIQDFTRALVDRGIQTYMHIVPMRPNQLELKKMVHLAWQLGMDGVRFLRFVSHGRGKSNHDSLFIATEELKNLINQLRTIVRSSPTSKSISFGGFTPYFPCRTYNISKNVCQAGRKFLHITSDGNIIPCPAFKQNRNSILGNIQGSNLTSVLSSAKLKAIINDIFVDIDGWMCPAHR